jgi:hypothetical protein
LEAKLLCSRLTSILVQANDLDHDQGASSPRDTTRVFTGIEHQVQIILQLGVRSATRSHEAGERKRRRLLEYYVEKLDPEHTHPDVRRFESQLGQYVAAADTVTWCKACQQPIRSTCWADRYGTTLDIWHEKCLACLTCNGEAAFDFGKAKVVCKYCKAENVGVAYRSAKRQFVFLLYVTLARLIKAKRLSAV